MLSLLHHQGLEVTVRQAMLQLCLKILDTGKLLMFLHSLMQFVSTWTVELYAPLWSLCEDTELPSIFLICHENLFPNSYSPMT